MDLFQLMRVLLFLAIGLCALSIVHYGALVAHSKSWRLRGVSKFQRLMGFFAVWMFIGNFIACISLGLVVWFWSSSAQAPYSNEGLIVILGISVLAMLIGSRYYFGALFFGKRDDKTPIE